MAFSMQPNFNATIGLLERALREDAADAEAVRKRYAALLSEITALAGHDAAADDSMFVPELHSVDVLVYEEDSASKQLVAVLTHAAKDRLAAALETAEDRLSDELKIAVNELMATKLPSVDRLRESGMTPVIHCMSHKPKAVVRTTKYGAGFKSLPKDSQGWWTCVSYATIVAPFGQPDLHDRIVSAEGIDMGPTSPFVGPKDTRRFEEFNEVIGQLLLAPDIPINRMMWPASWKRHIRLRLVQEGETAGTVCAAEAKEPVYILEVFASNSIRVISARIFPARSREDNHRINQGLLPIDPGQTELDAEIAEEAAISDLIPTDCVMNGLMAEALEGEVQSVMQESDACRQRAMGADDESCAELFSEKTGHDDAGWTESEDVSPTKEDEGFAITTLISELPPDVFNRDAGLGRKIINPFFCETEVFSKVKKKKVVCYPVASLFAYHRRIAIVTGPIVRGAFPRLVHTSSHIEAVFSQKRDQMKLPTSVMLSNFLAAKTLREGPTRELPSLMDADTSEFMKVPAKAHRVKTTRETSRRVLVSEQYKNYDDERPTCRFIDTETDAKCETGKKKRNVLCASGWCAKHCIDEQCVKHNKGNKRGANQAKEAEAGEKEAEAGEKRERPASTSPADKPGTKVQR